MPSDTWLMIIIAFGVFFFTSVFWIAYGSYRVDQLRQVHAAEVDMLKRERNTRNAMVVKVGNDETTR